MTKTIKATYDGRDIRLDEPLPLPRDTRVTVTVHAQEPEEDDDNDVGATTFFDVALSLDVEGPSDWSARIDHYLYGLNDGKA
ncbi:MAG TPA: hypothetical protein VFS20_10140 [Longimicrobium sp.]|nr:hypothetical protein [Longimicrobium sp.]